MKTLRLLQIITKRLQGSVGVRFIVLLIILTLSSSASLMAAWLDNVPVTVVQPNGDTLHLFATGDEYYHYTHDADGYTILQHPETGYYVYAIKKDNKLVASSYIYGTINPSEKGIQPRLTISDEDYRKKRREWEPYISQNRTEPTNQGIMNNIVLFVRFSNQSEFDQSYSSVYQMFNDESEGAVSMVNYFDQASWGDAHIISHLYPESNNTIVSFQDKYPRNYYRPKSIQNWNGYPIDDNDSEKFIRLTHLLDTVCYVLNGLVPSDLVIDNRVPDEVDNVIIVFNGDVDETEGSLLWPMNIHGNRREKEKINGKYACNFNFHFAGSENYFTVETFCHEMSHALGAPDMYHKNFGNYHDLHPVWYWDLQSDGRNGIPQQHTAYLKMQYDKWISEIPDITYAPNTYTLNALAGPTRENVAYKIRSADHPEQFYVLEYRNKDFLFDSSVPGKGLIIYRVDTTFEGKGNEEYNPPDDYDELYVFRPGGSPSNYNGNPNNAYFSAQCGRTSFNVNTDPYPYLTDGTTDRSISIFDITEAGNTISFTYGYKIEVSSNFEQAGTVTGGGLFAYNSLCTVTAIPDHGFAFLGWFKNVLGMPTILLSNNTSYTFTVSSDKELIAVFMPTNNTISFSDPAVKALCVANWDANDDGELSYAEAAAVTDLGTVFRENTEIVSFEELQFFTGLTSVNDYAFMSCSNLSGSVVIPIGVSQIGNQAFYGCSGLLTVSIPEAVTLIGNAAFEGCAGLSSVYVYADMPPALGTGVFAGLPTGIPIFVPCGSSEAYQLNESWNDFNLLGLCDWEITVTPRPYEGGTVTGTGTYTAGTMCTVTATANDNYVFGYWSENGVEVSTEAEYSFMVTSDRVLRAVFLSNGNITFADPNVKSICVANYDIDEDGELSYVEAAFVYSLGQLFKGNTEITSFEELQYFEQLASISDSAFYGCTNLTGALHVPNSVTSIGNFAFSGCSGLTGTLTIPNSVIQIGDNAFFCCSGFNGSLILSNSLTTIGTSAFYGCSGLTGDLVIPNSVTHIGDYAFNSCGGFNGSLTLSNSLTTIGAGVFRECRGLTGSLIIPNSVTSIEHEAFLFCSGFTGSLTLGNSLSTIGFQAFYWCSGLTGSLILPNSLITIGQSAFYECGGLTGSLTIPNSVTSIDGSAFYYCRGFSGELVIGNSVTSIGPSAFYACDGLLGDLTIPNSVTSIGSSAFFSCSGLNGNLVIPSSVRSIGNEAFAYCSFSSGTWSIPETGITIGELAFNHCWLTSINSFADTPPTLDSHAAGLMKLDFPVLVPCGAEQFYHNATGWSNFSSLYGMCSGEVNVIVNPTSGGSVSGAGLYNAGELCTLTATPNPGYEFAFWSENGVMVSSERVYSFYAHPTTIEAIFLSSAAIVFADFNVKTVCVSRWDRNADGELSYAEAAAVMSLGGAFRNNTSITSFDELQFFTGLTHVTQEFASCSNLVSVVLPSSISMIGYCAFDECSALTSVIIPESVTEIGMYAFYHTGLSGNLVIPNSVVTIGNYAFEGCSGLTSVTVGNGVNEMGVNAFNQCDGLEAVYYTGDLAQWCSIDFRSGVMVYDIESNPLYYAHNLYIDNELVTLLVLPETVTEIKELAFVGATCLVSIVIPNSINNIGRCAFLDCSGLNSIVSHSSVPVTLGYSAFQYTNKNIPVVVPCGSVEAYQTASGWNEFTNIIGMCSPETITVSSDPLEGGSVSGSGSFDLGSICTVTATPNQGYYFYYWKENGIIVSEHPNYSFAVEGSRSLVAEFSCNNPTDVIQFADFVVKSICVQHWDANGDGELSYGEASAVTSLGEVFRGNTEIVSFEELQYFIRLDGIGDYAFQDCSNLAGTLLIPNSVTYIGYAAFQNCSNLTGDLVIPNSVTFINARAFQNCYGFQGSLSLGNSVTVIGLDAFWVECAIEKHMFTGPLILPNSLESIGGRAFMNCGFTGDLIIPNSVTYIGNGAFLLDGAINSLTIGNSVTNIGAEAFNTINICQTTFIVLAETPPTLGNLALNGISRHIPMFVPCGSVEAYQTAPGWNEFTNIEDICSPRTVTVVANPDEYGTVSGAGVFDFGVMCTVSAVPNEGYCFYYWTEEGNVVSTDADYSFVVSTDHVFEAVFGLPITITMSANMVEGGTVSGDGVYAYGDICTITAVSNEGYSFLDWNANGETVSYLAAYSFTVTESVEFVADFAPHGGALIGGAESTSPYLPSHSQYKYSLSQQIYTSAELGGSRVINSIAFFNTGVTKTRSFDIYMVHTEKETFAINTDWIPVVESDLVYSGSMTMTQGEWNNIIFDVPFVYDGNANLAIIIDDNTGDYSGYPWMDYLDCRVFNTSSIQAIYTNGYGVNYDPSLPVSYEGSLESVKNQIILNMEAETNQVASFTQGVTWWSPTVFAPDLLGQLEQLLGGDGAMINSQYSGFAQYENGAWSGMLDAVLPGQMYKIQTTAPCEVTLNGSIINPYDCPITIQPNWNWIGYPCPVQRTVTSAFSNLIPEDGDILRGQSAYAVYYAGYGWFPPNMTLTPGAGYLYQSNASESKTFVIGNSRENIPQRVGLHWKSRMDGCSSVAYVTAALVYDGEELRGDSVELGAFVNGICRGCARLTYFEPTGRWYVMLAITANEGEQIDFIIIDESRGWVDVMSSDHLEFKGHAMTGTLDNPCIIQFGAKNSSH